jgi:HSP20 family molecular chaperone IbpA
MLSFLRHDPYLFDIMGTNQVGLHQPPHAARDHHYLYETDDAVTLSIDIPGVKSSDLHIHCDDNVIHVSGERKTAGSESKFTRTFAMDPKNVDVDNLKANLDCGVLTLTVPKRSKPAIKKAITVTESPLPEAQPSVATPKSS